MNRLATTIVLAALLAVAGLRPAHAQSISGVEPANPYPGHPVTISGSGFNNNTTDVSYNGTSVAFTALSDSEVRARVPTGATTDASFEVTTDAGTATSATISLDTEPGLYGPRRALAVDGSGDYVATGANGSDLGLADESADESFSVGVWFKLNSTADDRTLVGMNGGTDDKTLHLVIKDDRTARFGFYDNDLDTPSGTVTTGTWTHLTFVYDASKSDGETDRFIYKNGEQVASDNTSSKFQGTSEVLIGRWGGDKNYFDGEIDQVRVWKGALTQAEVRERAYRTIAPGEAAFSELEGAWRFDAGGTTTAFEQTANYRFGMVQGDPQRQAASGARLGQESATTTGSGATVGPSGGALSATGVSAGSDEAVQLYRFGTTNGPTRDGSDAGEDGLAGTGRSNLTWGLATNGSPSADLEIDYSGVQGISGPVRLIRRDGPGAAWQRATGWTQNESAQTFTNSGTVPEGQYAVVPSAVVYVDESATGAGDGSSWTDAYTDLQTAIDNATSSNEIWIAEGVYKPDGEGESFTITGAKDGIEVYGGFESGDAFSDRDPKENRTILSGDVDDNDDDPDGDGIIEDASDLVGGENAHHVLFLDGTNGDVTSSTVLDGLVVTAGQADGSSSDDYGGGLFCDGYGSDNVCSPTLANALFAGNEATDFGGAIYNDGSFSGTSSPEVTNATFTGNTASNSGGAIYNDSENNGTSSPSITNATFTGNSASKSGGAIFNYGRSNGTSSPSVTNATFTGNEADDGGAIYNSSSPDGTSNPQVANTILWGNSASDSGDEIYNDNASATLTHTIIEGGVNGSGVGGDDNTDGGDNLDQDPNFEYALAPAGSDDTYATDEDGLHVLPGSPALDAGNNDEVPTGVDEDITGADRIQNGTVDIGAYEGGNDPARTIYVEAGAAGGDGLGWGEALSDLQRAIDNANGNDELWVAEGVYRPDDGPRVPDGKADTSFVITGNKDGLEVYGGFESGDAFSDRDPKENRTILSGDIDGDDNTDADGVTPTADDISGTNAHHVLVLNGGDGLGSDVDANVTSSTVLDGLVITAGQADGSKPNNRGGGLYCDGAYWGNKCSPTLANALFAGNEASRNGGAIYNNGEDGTSSPRVTNATFTGNTADDGGAIYNFGRSEGTSSPSITNATFTGNGADYGGAIYNYGDGGTSSPSITNATFTGNTADDGGAIYNSSSPDGTSNPQVANTILWGNAADGDGSGSGDEIFNNEGASATLTHTIIEGGVNGSGTNGGNTGDGLDEDPQFADASTPAGPDGTLATADDGLNVVAGSPALDAGTNDSVSVSTDLTGADRTQDRDDDGTATVNIGAYEEAFLAPPVAQTGSASNIGGTTADLGGTVNPKGLETSVQAQIYPTSDPSAVRTLTGENSPLTGDTGQSVTVPLDGLSPDTEYKARVLANNEDGVDQGSLVTFTTAAGYTRSITGTDGTGNDAGWRMLALPAAGKDRSALEGDLTFSTNSGSILYRWTSGSWTAQTSSSNDLPRGRGFMLFFFDDVIDPIDAEGLPLAVSTGNENQSEDKPVDGLSTDETFHLLGNPFDVAFDLSELNLPGQGFQETVQIWDPSSESYTQVTQSGDQSDVVGAWQGFFVERDPNASTDGTSLTFSTDGKQSGPGTIIGSQAAALADTKRSDEKRLRLGLRLAVVDSSSEEDTSPPAPQATTAQAVPSREPPDSLTAEAAATQSSDGAQAAEAEADTVGTGRLGLLLSSGAKPGWDAYEASQLGPPGGGESTVALTSPLERGSDESIQRALASEPYPGENAAVTVPVSMQARAGSGQATIRLSESQREQVPSGWALRLTDTRAGEQADLLTEAYRFTLDETGGAGATAPPESRFRLAVGPRGALPTPDGLALEAPYPNPTTRSVTVEYAVPRQQADGAQLQLYDVLGRRVRTVSVKPGPRTQRLDVSGLASGVYILRLTAEGAQQTRKLTVVR